MYMKYHMEFEEVVEKDRVFSRSGAGDSDWYSTKAEMDYAAELEDLYLQKLERFAVGDLGTRQADFEKFVNSHREQYEERVRLGIIEE